MYIDEIYFSRELSALPFPCLVHSELTDLAIWQYGLLSIQAGYTILKRSLPKNPTKEIIGF